MSPAGSSERSKNLRQLLLKASRRVHTDIVEALNQRGYPELRPIHTTLLTNLELAGESVSRVAEKAGMTKQAMGRVAAELQGFGYLHRKIDPTDGRALRLTLTASGRRMMETSFRVMDDLERDYARALGSRAYRNMRSALSTLSGDGR